MVLSLGLGPDWHHSVRCFVEVCQIGVKWQKAKVSGTYSSKDSDSPKPGSPHGCARSRGIQTPLAGLAPCPHTSGTRVREKGAQAVKNPSARPPSPTRVGVEVTLLTAARGSTVSSLLKEDSEKVRVQTKVFSQSSPFRLARQRVRAHVPVCVARRGAGRPPFRPQAGIAAEDPFFLFSLSQLTHTLEGTQCQ